MQSGVGEGGQANERVGEMKWSSEDVLNKLEIFKLFTFCKIAYESLQSVGYCNISKSFILFIFYYYNYYLFCFVYATSVSIFFFF